MIVITLTSCLIALIGVQHVGFLVLEMFLWTKPIGLKIFRLQKDFADRSATLAANQGLYNGFLAAGIFWSLLAPDSFSFSLRNFFLICVIVAGIYGGRTVNRRIFFIQALPAVIALALTWLL